MSGRSSNSCYLALSVKGCAACIDTLVFRIEMERTHYNTDSVARSRLGAGNSLDSNRRRRSVCDPQYTYIAPACHLTRLRYMLPNGSIVDNHGELLTWCVLRPRDEKLEIEAVGTAGCEPGQASYETDHLAWPRVMLEP